MNTIERYATTGEIAELLNKPRSWVLNNQARLDIPRYKVGNQFRYRLSEVAQWMDARSVTVDGR